MYLFILLFLPYTNFRALQGPTKLWGSEHINRSLDRGYFLCYFSCLHCAHYFSLSWLAKFDWILSFGILATINQMADENKVVDPALAGFHEAMEKTNAEKIANEMLAGISEN
jgi:hypothetical protein